MVDPIAPPAPIAPSIVSTPPPEPVKAPESVLFPTTPPAAVVVTPAAPTEPSKAPTEPTKPEVPATPPTAPTEYVLTLPEGSLLSAEDLAAINKEAKDAKLTKEQAEGVLKSRNDVATSVSARFQAQAKAQQEKAFNDAKALWKSEVEKDPVLGGEHLAETTLLSSRGYNALTTPEERKVIESIGMDYHPIFTRMMAKVGKMIGEDPRLILGSGGGAPEPRAREAVLYGKTTPDGTGAKTG